MCLSQLWRISKRETGIGKGGFDAGHTFTMITCDVIPTVLKSRLFPFYERYIFVLVRKKISITTANATYNYTTDTPSKQAKDDLIHTGMLMYEVALPREDTATISPT